MADGSPSPRRSVGLLVTFVLVVAGGLAAAYAVLTLTRPGTPAARGVACTAPQAPPPTYPTFTAAPDPTVAADSSWRATVHTTCGDVTVVLDGRAAPRSVASFVTLARAGYWTDSVCHRLTTRQAPTEFLQCGDPSGRSTAEPGYDLPLENVPADGTYRVGDVGLARGDGYPGTAGEFFVVHEDFTVPAGSPVYSLVGRVLSGQSVVQHVAAAGGEDTRPDGPPFLSVSVRSVDVSPVR